MRCERILWCEATDKKQKRLETCPVCSGDQCLACGGRLPLSVLQPQPGARINFRQMCLFVLITQAGAVFRLNLSFLIWNLKN